MAVSTLYDKCIFNITNTLKNSTRLHGIRLDIANPFAHLSSHLINDLMEATLQHSAKQLFPEDVYYLLTSGHLEHLKLVNVSIRMEDFISILKYFMPKSQNLRSLIIKDLEILNKGHRKMRLKQAQALKFLLLNSPQLEFIDSCVTFNLNKLWKCGKLRTVKLNFGNFPEGDNRRSKLFQKHCYLQVLSPILFCCTELTFINVDISLALEHMHKEELKENRLKRQYKIEKCYLNRSQSDPSAVNDVVVRIATLTCPNLKELDVVVKNYKTISFLGDFKCLASLDIMWKPAIFAEFQITLLPVLKKIGSTLQCLVIKRFSKVDLAAIAVTCPKIEKLFTTNCTHLKTETFPAVDLQCLKTMTLATTSDSGDTWIALLSHSPNITYLCINNADSLDDAALQKTLSKSKFSYLTDVKLFITNLSPVGIKKLVLHLKNLKYLILHSRQVHPEIVRNIVQQTNSSVVFRSIYDLF